MTALFCTGSIFWRLKLLGAYFKATAMEYCENCPFICMHSTILRDIHELQTLHFAYFFTRFPLPCLVLTLFSPLSFLPIGNDNAKTPLSRIFLSRFLSGSQRGLGHQGSGLKNGGLQGSKRKISGLQGSISFALGLQTQILF